jgi:hypothetical protein
VVRRIVASRLRLMHDCAAFGFLIFSHALDGPDLYDASKDN